MDNQLDESVRPVKRRRSSILGGKALGIPSNDGSPAPKNEAKTSESSVFSLKLPRYESTSAVDETTIINRIKDLKAEAASWKDLHKERKALQNSTNRVNSPPKLSWNNTSDFLSEECIHFLKDTPPFEKITKDFDRVVESTATLRTKYRVVNEMASGVQSLMQSRLSTIKQNIAEFDDKSPGFIPDAT